MAGFAKKTRKTSHQSLLRWFESTFTIVGIYKNDTTNSSIKNARSLDLSRLLDTASKLTVILGGSGWIRTTEGGANRFTVCPLWPLGNTPIYTIQKNGAGGRTRTPDLLITNQLLYQLSYTSNLMLDYYITKEFRCQENFSFF